MGATESEDAVSVAVDFREDTDLAAWSVFLRKSIASSPEMVLLRNLEKRMAARNSTRIVTVNGTIEINESGDAEGVVSDAIVALCNEHGWRFNGGVEE
jgi:hypothetical protein